MGCEAGEEGARAERRRHSRAGRRGRPGGIAPRREGGAGGRRPGTREWPAARPEVGKAGEAGAECARSPRPGSRLGRQDGHAGPLNQLESGPLRRGPQARVCMRVPPALGGIATREAGVDSGAPVRDPRP